MAASTEEINSCFSIKIEGTRNIMNLTASWRALSVLSESAERKMVKHLPMRGIWGNVKTAGSAHDENPVFLHDSSYASLPKDAGKYLTSGVLYFPGLTGWRMPQFCMLVLDESSRVAAVL